MKRVIGITGGIASGKSNVCNILKGMGYPLIDCDQINLELSKKNGPIYTAILSRFGEDYLDDNGEINRKKLGKLIFNNSAAKIVLDQVTHPIILEEIKNQIKSVPDGLIFVEIPLLYEAKFEFLCDKIICVFLNKKDQVIRLMQREGIDEDYALSKIHSQMDLYLKKELSDYVINSKGTFEETRKQVVDVIKKIKGEPYGNN